MNRCKWYEFVRPVLFTGILLVLASLQEPAFALVVNFETVPTIPTGPDTFNAAGPAQTIDVNGVVTFSGGVVLGFPIFLPASPFSTAPNVYGTANAPSIGVAADPSLTPTISVSISTILGATTFEGLLFNGFTQPVSYTIDAYSGSNVVDSVFLPNLESNLSSGFTEFRLSSGGPSITSVLFNPDTTGTSGQWDYFIDTIAINQPIETVPLPASAVLFATGLMGWAGIRRLGSPSIA